MFFYLDFAFLADGLAFAVSLGLTSAFLGADFGFAASLDFVSTFLGADFAFGVSLGFTSAFFDEFSTDSVSSVTLGSYFSSRARRRLISLSFTCNYFPMLVICV